MSDPEPYQVLQVFIQSVSFSVNPVNINSKTVLSVKVQEKTVTVYPPVVYSKETYAGEV